MFLKGRNQKLNRNIPIAKEFFYGATLLDVSKYEVELIELNENCKGFISNLLYYFDLILAKTLNLPFNTSKFLTRYNFSKLIKSDHIFLVNESVAFSTLPILFILKLFKKIKISVFVMGLHSKNAKFKFLNIIRKNLVKFLFYSVDHVLLLGFPEYTYSINNFKKCKKFIYLPFSIDLDFWKFQSQTEKKYDLIFVGNDLNRDYQLLLELAIEMPYLKFLVVSNNKIFDNTNLSNLEIIKGHWGSDIISDIDLRNLYLQSKISVLPIKDSLQPSGQSVALQCMALKIPVIISDTVGFWDRKMFKSNKHLVLIENKKSFWVQTINNLLDDQVRLNKLTDNAYQMVSKNFNLNNFIQNIEKLINNP